MKPLTVSQWISKWTLRPILRKNFTVHWENRKRENIVITVFRVVNGQLAAISESVSYKSLAYSDNWRKELSYIIRALRARLSKYVKEQQK